MAGLSGLFDRRSTRSSTELEGWLRVMNGAQRRREDLLEDSWCAAPFALGRVHPGIYDAAAPPVHDEARRYALYFDGELYDRPDADPVDKIRDAEFFLARYLYGGDWDFLAELDGIFAAALVDTQDECLFLVSDRLGLRPVHYWVSPEAVAFSSEIKSIISLPGFDARVDRTAFEEFMAFGYMMGERTWFDGIRVLEPATVLKVGRGGEPSQTCYWSWSDLPAVPDGITVEEAAEEVGRLWKRAVESKVRPQDRYCLALSGGLDSRAVLAALPPDRVPMPCVTMGAAGADDVTIAARAAAAGDCPHHVVPLGQSDNWLSRREDPVWDADGLITMLHLHGVAMREPFRELSTIALQGFVGDLVVGGSYVGDTSHALSYFRKKYCPAPTMTGFDGAAHALSLWERSGLTLEQFGMHQRVRRFTLVGSRLFSADVEMRKPFVDRDFMFFTMGMPERLRKGSAAYRLMLLREFPRFFEKIEWQRTGLPITSGSGREWLAMRMKGARLRLGLVERRLPRWLRPKKRWFVLDYGAKIREPVSQGYIRERLVDKAEYVPEFVPQDKLRAAVEAHMAGRASLQETIVRLLTAEVYLGMVYSRERT